jgi:diketogulonate reductase-like aldo/keto reductase
MVENNHIEREVTLNNGLKMSRIGLGTYKIIGEGASDCVKTAILEGNYRHIDTAYFYGNEKEVGAGVVAAIDSGKVAREDLWVTTKMW